MISSEQTADAMGATGAARATSETILDDDTVTLNVRTASIDLDGVRNEGRESKDDATTVESKGYDGDGGGISEIARSLHAAFRPAAESPCGGGKGTHWTAAREAPPPG